MVDLLKSHDASSPNLRALSAGELARRRNCRSYVAALAAHDDQALGLLTGAQLRRLRSMRRQYSVKGWSLMSCGTLTVGYETEQLGRDRDAEIGPDGTVLSRRNSSC